MYVDIWDIEIITHAAKREREREREGETGTTTGLGYAQPGVVV